MGCVKGTVLFLGWYHRMKFPPSLRGGERRGLGQRPISTVRKANECRRGTWVKIVVLVTFPLPGL